MDVQLNPAATPSDPFCFFHDQQLIKGPAQDAGNLEISTDRTGDIIP
jgi:hypothetical protein